MFNIRTQTCSEHSLVSSGERLPAQICTNLSKLRLIRTTLSMSTNRTLWTSIPTNQCPTFQRNSLAIEHESVNLTRLSTQSTRIPMYNQPAVSLLLFFNVLHLQFLPSWPPSFVDSCHTRHKDCTQSISY